MAQARPTRNPKRVNGSLIYFDTNVYALMANQGCVSEVKRLLRRCATSVLGSAFNLFESFRTVDPERRAAHVRAISALAWRHEEEPQLYKQAMELLNEIRRRRPEWLSKSPDMRLANEHRRVEKELWVEIRRDPYYLPENVALYRATSSTGVRIKRDHQRKLRARQIRDGFLTLRGRILLPKHHVDLQASLDALSFLDAYWRTGSAWTWFAALHGDPFLSDSGDFLRPHLAVSEIKFGPWLEFWVHEADPERLKRDRLAAFTDYYQTHHSITTGNAVDIAHSGYLLDVDLLITQDKDFFQILSRLRQDHFPTAAPASLVASSDPLSSIAEVLIQLKTSGKRQP